MESNQEYINTVSTESIHPWLVLCSNDRQLFKRNYRFWTNVYDFFIFENRVIDLNSHSNLLSSVKFHTLRNQPIHFSIITSSKIISFHSEVRLFKYYFDNHCGVYYFLDMLKQFWWAFLGQDLQNVSIINHTKHMDMDLLLSKHNK